MERSTLQDGYILRLHSGVKACKNFPFSCEPSKRTGRATRVLIVRADLTKDLRPKSEPIVIKGGKGKAAHVKKNDVIKIVNTHGSQVVDFWAFSIPFLGRELMSMHHTRNALCRTTPRAGDVLYTASMVPIMTFLEDSGPGVHDTTAAACRPRRRLEPQTATIKVQWRSTTVSFNCSYGLYVLQIGKEAADQHDSCTNNLYEALKELDLQLAEDPRKDYYTPAPFNLWMNVSDEPDASGYNWIAPPKEQKPGDYVVFRAEQDAVIAFSACPWDIGDMNGAGGKPKDCSFQLFE